MRKIFFILMAGILLCSCDNIQDLRNQSPKGNFNQRTVSTQYFDTVIADPFRQIENLKDSNVIIWFRQQGEYADKILDQIPGREELIKKMIDYDHRKQYHIDQIKVNENKSYFYLKRTPKEEIFKLYYRASINSAEELLFDPSLFRKNDSVRHIINSYSPDWAGEKIAIAIESNGSDILEIIILDVIHKKILPHSISHHLNTTQVASWTPDNQGFLYLSCESEVSSENARLLNTKTKYYRLDRKTSVDVFSKSFCPNLNIQEEDFPIVSFNHPDDKYIFGTPAGASMHHDCYYMEIEDVHHIRNNWKPFYKKKHQVIKGVCSGNSFVFLSSNNASNNAIYRTNLNNPDFDHPELIVAEKENEVIQDFKITSSGLFYNTTKNGVEVKLYFTDYKSIRNIDLQGTFGRLFLDHISDKKTDLWVSVAGWTTDIKRMRYDMVSGQFIEEELVPMADFHEFGNFQVEEVVVKSHDGVMVPLSIISKTGVEKNGENPCLLYGYGAYGIPWRPYFLPDWLTWVEEGGILCFSHVRGGGEKGVQWHLGGKNQNKPNSWKDFIACSRYLIEKNYTSNTKLAIYGGSAGGIVIGRSMTERPDLYAAVISEVGMLNATRIHEMPSGLNHAKEFGYINDSSNYKDLIEMDAYLHLKNSMNYPPFLSIVGMNDLRVSPWQSGKFVARMQSENQSGNIVLMMVDFEEGHYFNSTRTASIEKLASIFSFAFNQLGHPKYQQTKQ